MEELEVRTEGLEEELIGSGLALGELDEERRARELTARFFRDAGIYTECGEQYSNPFSGTISGQGIVLGPDEKLRDKHVSGKYFLNRYENLFQWTLEVAYFWRPEKFDPNKFPTKETLDYLAQETGLSRDVFRLPKTYHILGVRVKVLEDNYDSSIPKGLGIVHQFILELEASKS